MTAQENELREDEMRNDIRWLVRTPSAILFLVLVFSGFGLLFYGLVVNIFQLWDGSLWVIGAPSDIHWIIGTAIILVAWVMGMLLEKYWAKSRLESGKEEN